MMLAQQNRILKKIDLLKKEMAREKKQWGGYHDGRGLRYSIMDLYIKLGDYKKTNRYLSWFDKTFPDDSTYAFFQFGAAVTKFQLKKFLDCKVRMLDVIKENTYLPFLLIGEEIGDQNKLEQYEGESITWAREQLDSFKEVTDEKFLIWLYDFMKEEHFIKNYGKLVDFRKQAKMTDNYSDVYKMERELFEEWRFC